MFVLDSSGSVSTANFQTVKQVVSEISGLFTWGYANGAQMGVVRYSSSSSIIIPIKTYQAPNTQTDFQTAVSQVVYVSGSTNTAAGINQGQGEIATNGRPTSAAAIRLLMVITDGTSDSTSATITAANNARAAGTTVAVMTIGSSFAPGEIPGIAGGDSSLIFPIENWAQLKAGGFVGNLTSRACDQPAQINNLTPVDANVGCNTTIFLAYYPNATAPLTLTVNVSDPGVGLALCFSYADTKPLPAFALPAGKTPSPNTTCTTVNGGLNTVATVTAYPFGNVTRKTGTPALANLYVSVTSYPTIRANTTGNVTGNGTLTTCGGAFSVRAGTCYSRLTYDVPVLPGLRALVGEGPSGGHPPLASGGGGGEEVPWYGPGNITVRSYGDTATNTVCAGCPTGMAFLGIPGTSLENVCAPLCGARTFFNLTAPLPACTACDATCGTCVHPGGPRSCTSCPPGYALLPNDADAAFTSPMWEALVAAAAAGNLSAASTAGGPGAPLAANGSSAVWWTAAQRAGLLPPLPTDPLARGITMTPGGLMLNATAGRCVPLCPAAAGAIAAPSGTGSGARRLDAAPAEGAMACTAAGAAAAAASLSGAAASGSASGASAAAASPASYLAGVSSSVLVTMCAPQALFPPATASAGRMVACDAFAASAANARMAATLAAALAVPPAAVFLRSCLDVTTTGTGSNGTRVTWAYNASVLASGGASALAAGVGVTPAVPPFVGGANATYNLIGAFANATGGVNASTGMPAAGVSGCGCAALVTYAYLPAVAAPGALAAGYSGGLTASAASAAIALAATNVTTDATIVAARAAAALAVLSANFSVRVQTAAGSQYLPPGAPGSGVTSGAATAYIPPAFALSAGPFAPIRLACSCDAAVNATGGAVASVPVAVALLACVDNATAPTALVGLNLNTPTTSDGTTVDTAHRDPLTLCAGFLPQHKPYVPAPAPSPSPAAPPSPPPGGPSPSAGPAAPSPGPGVPSPSVGPAEPSIQPVVPSTSVVPNASSSAEPVPPVDPGNAAGGGGGPMSPTRAGGVSALVLLVLLLLLLLCVYFPWRARRARRVAQLLAAASSGSGIAPTVSKGPLVSAATAPRTARINSMAFASNPLASLFGGGGGDTRVITNNASSALKRRKQQPAPPPDDRSQRKLGFRPEHTVSTRELTEDEAASPAARRQRITAASGSRKSLLGSDGNGPIALSPQMAPVREESGVELPHLDAAATVAVRSPSPMDGVVSVNPLAPPASCLAADEPRPATQAAPPPPPPPSSGDSSMGEVVLPAGGFRGLPTSTNPNPYSFREKALEFLLPGSVSLRAGRAVAEPPRHVIVEPPPALAAIAASSPGPAAFAEPSSPSPDSASRPKPKSLAEARSMRVLKSTRTNFVTESTRALPIGNGVLQVEKVKTETVTLRRVDAIKGDATFTSMRNIGAIKDHSYTGTVGRQTGFVPVGTEGAAGAPATAAAPAGMSAHV